ncbi:hypothetical protein RUND412_009703 [Rhizina undulata]
MSTTIKYAPRIPLVRNAVNKGIPRPLTTRLNMVILHSLFHRRSLRQILADDEITTFQEEYTRYVREKMWEKFHEDFLKERHHRENEEGEAREAEEWQGKRAETRRRGECCLAGEETAAAEEDGK